MMTFLIFVHLTLLSFAAGDRMSSVRKRSDDYGPLEAQVAHLAQEVTSLQAQLKATSDQLQSVSTRQGSTYVRWGRVQCPQSAQLVYSGRAGGSYRENTGRAPNRLCLPLVGVTPEFEDDPVPAYYGRLYGAEYLQIASHHMRVVPCAVCHVPRGSTLMIPAALTCPQGWQYSGHLASGDHNHASIAEYVCLGWQKQYSGHLASEDHDHASIAEYVCLDGEPEDAIGSGGTTGPASYFYFTVFVCGVLPCPPYRDGKVVTCVVCSA